jgi:phytoene dehydrogenase-like protein
MLSSVAPGLRERIVHRWVLTPADLESRYACTEGNLSHGEVALDQILFMRPVPVSSRYATPLAGLWLCGTGTHPGSSSGAAGMLVAREIESVNVESVNRSGAENLQMTSDSPSQPRQTILGRRSTTRSRPVQ